MIQPFSIQDGNITYEDHPLITLLRRNNLTPPCLLYFPQILKSQADSLETAFKTAIKETGYQGNFQGVYPIKANPHAAIVTAIPDSFGLEVGTKAELMVGLQFPNRPLICNGHKDRQMLEMIQHHPNSIAVIEHPQEVEAILSLPSQAIGIRIGLSISGSGHWANCSKFGLRQQELHQVIARLKEKGRIQDVKLLHYHIGSQTPQLGSHIEALKKAIEIMNVLRADCPNLTMLDIGGGLGITYSPGDISYNTCSYASEIITTLAKSNLPPLTLITESGRYLSAPSQVLVTEVLWKKDAHPHPIYYGNFSMFRSLPDHCSIGQEFPIFPLTRMDQPRTMKVQLADLTCDSDGCTRSPIWLHPLKPNQPYLLGIFMVGAYQQIMGNSHNLLGRPPMAVVENGSIQHLYPGETISDVLWAQEYTPIAAQQSTYLASAFSGTVTIPVPQPALSSASA